jgi:cyclohexa-1,5-dienecarbonyl-CoA hydratase
MLQQQDMEKIKFNLLHDGAVAQLIFDDGKGNVLDSVMMGELQELLNSFKKNPNIKLIMFEGAGKHFSFGASVEEHKKDAAQVMLHSFHQLFYTLRDLSIPALAKISGQCLGGGMEIAIMCHFLFADKTAKMGQPEILLGVFPPPASIILPEKIGLARAEDILLTGKSITAEEAKKLGLINEVFDDRSALEAGVNEFIATYILPKSASSLRFGVKASRAKFNHVLTNFLATLEQLYVKDLMNTHDANEGILSFLEKRTPDWKNN